MHPVDDPRDPARVNDADPCHTGAAVGERDGRELLEITGADRVRFLNGYLTCDVKRLGVGRVAYGFFTARDGRVLADAWVGALGAALVVSLPAGHGVSVAEHLSRYLLTDRVALRRREALVPLHLVGPAAGRVLVACGLASPERGGVETVARGEEAWVALRRDLGPLPGVELWVGAAERESVAAALAAAGATPATGERFETVRVEQGVPRFAVDFDAEHFPQETGLGEEAVSYDKGCYLGQEVVARIHYRGGVQRELRALRFAGQPPVPGTAVLCGGREAGRATSVARSPRHGAIGLGILHRRVDEAPGDLRLADGGFVRLASRPFSAEPDALGG